MPGSDSENQLKLIIKMIGVPDKQTINKYCGGKTPEFFQKSQEKGDTSKFKKRFEGIDHTAMELLKLMLVFNPINRISIEDSLKHPFFEDLH